MNIGITATDIFFPHHLEREKRIRENKSKFVHYTSSDTGISIIRNKEIWMRNALSMNDYREVQYGVDHVVAFFKSKDADRFWTLLDSLHLNFGDEIRQLFDGWLSDLQTHTYITCVSEHDPIKDSIGRLSMWRGYGKQNGVALVFNPEPMVTESDALKAYSFPVLYLKEMEMKDQFNRIIDNMVRYEGYLKKMNKVDLTACIFNMLHSFCVCLKHSGFEEEKEWRVVYRPNQNKSVKIVKEIISIDGSPQRVYKIPLKDIPEEGLLGLNIESLIDRIIIGPNKNAFAVCDAYVEELSAAGIPNPHERVIFSDIPLRT